MRGSVVKRTLKDGTVTYYCVTEETAPDGKRRRRWHSDPTSSAGFTSKKAAEKRLTKLVASIDEGTYVTPDNCTLSEWLDTWLVTKRTTLKASTYAGYVKVLRVHVRPRIGQVRLQQVDYDVCQRLLAELDAGGRADHREGEPLSPRTVRQVSAVLSSALTAAVDSGRIAANPMQRVTRSRRTAVKRTTAAPPKAWTPAQTTRFLDATKDDATFGALWRFLATTGVRRGEALGLRWCDLDLDAGTATIEQTLLKVAGKVITDTPKSAAGHRGIPLDAATVASLRAHRARQAEQRLMLGLGKSPADGFVFTSPTAEPLHPERVTKVFAAKVAELDLPHLTPHGMRHTWATTAMRAGVNPKVVQERLGHSHVSVTLGTYSHLLGDDMQVQAAELVASLFDAPAADAR